MRLPWVSRAALDAETTHREAAEHAFHAECARHDATRAELSRVTERLAQIAVAAAAPMPAPAPVPASVSSVVTDAIEEIAEGDSGLRMVLRKRALAWRKRFPNLSDAELADCLRTNSLPSQEATA